MKQHITLLVIAIIGVFLILYFIQTRSVMPRQLQLDAQIRNSRHQLSQLQTQLATREAMDLPTMREALAKAQETLRTVQISGSTEGPPFLSDHEFSKIASFQSQISDLAAQNRLYILNHTSINSTDSKLQELILRELHVRGSFMDFLNFIESLGSLPYRTIVIKIEIEVDPDNPTELISMLRYSV